MPPQPVLPSSSSFYASMVVLNVSLIKNKCANKHRIWKLETIFLDENTKLSGPTSNIIQQQCMIFF